MPIINSTAADIDEIFKLYRIATEYQKPRFTVQWPEFDRQMVETEIIQLQQWKIIENDEILCV